MKILMTGTDGYIGCLAAPTLTGAGHEVTGVDTGLYREGWLFSNGSADSPLCLDRRSWHIP